jgi:hypothetical protein
VHKKQSVKGKDKSKQDIGKTSNSSDGANSSGPLQRNKSTDQDKSNLFQSMQEDFVKPRKLRLAAVFPSQQS